MMRLPVFRYLAPRSLPEAARLLAEAGPQARLVAGGTDLYPNMKRLQTQPPVLISLHALSDLAHVRRLDDGGLALGSGLTLTHLSEHPLVRVQCPALAEAALLVSTPPLRNMGTLGGNLCVDTRCHFINQTAFWRGAVGSCLKDVGDVCRVAPGSDRCWAITSADLPPLLIALNARVRLVSVRGERVLPLADLYQDDGIDYLALAPDEVLAEVLLPPLAGVRAVYLKLRRRGTFDFPALGVAAAIQAEPGGACRTARIVLGAVTSRPLDMPQAAQLVGQPLTDEAIAAVAESLTRQARPLHLADFTHSYRKQMVGVYVGRALRQLAHQG
jgi:4-hydroxybenzoyl-CoA reductase subunit beta